MPIHSEGFTLADSPLHWAYTLNGSMRTHFEVQRLERGRDASLARSEFGAGELYSAIAPSQVLRHFNDQRNADEVEHSYLIQIRSGALGVASGGRKVILANGDCAIVDSRQDFTLSSNSSTQGVVIRFPVSWLGAWVSNPEDLIARRVDAEVGWGRALSASVSNLDPLRIDDLGSNVNSIAEHVAMLISLASYAVSPEGGDVALRKMREVKRVLERSFADANLGPESVSGQLGISKRYLHYIFAACGTTFGRELLEIRLGKAYRMLCAAGGSGAVLKVAMSSGFSDSSHFSKKFKERYGVSPVSLVRQA